MCDRLILRRHIHKKTIVQGDKEETIVTETTHVEQDSEPPEDLSESIQEVIDQFMGSGSDREYGAMPTTDQPPPAVEQ